jgi:hypothetical protein
MAHDSPSAPTDDHTYWTIGSVDMRHGDVRAESVEYLATWTSSSERAADV